MSQNQEAKQFPTMDGNLQAFETPSGAAIRQKSNQMAIAAVAKDLRWKQKQTADGIPESEQTVRYALVMPVGKPELGQPGHHYEKMWEVLEQWDPTNVETTTALEEAGHIIRGFESVEVAILAAELSYSANNAMVGMSVEAE